MTKYYFKVGDKIEYDVGDQSLYVIMSSHLKGMLEQLFETEKPISITSCDYSAHRGWTEEFEHIRLERESFGYVDDEYKAEIVDSVARLMSDSLTNDLNIHPKEDVFAARACYVYGELFSLDDALETVEFGKGVDIFNLAVHPELVKAVHKGSDLRIYRKCVLPYEEFCVPADDGYYYKEIYRLEIDHPDFNMLKLRSLLKIKPKIIDAMENEIHGKFVCYLKRHELVDNWLWHLLEQRKANEK